MTMEPMRAPGGAEVRPLQVGMVLYPGFTLLDLVGPQAVLGLHGQTHLLWKTRDPVVSDSGPAMLPTTTFAACPEDLDILFVPGGMGTADALEDTEILQFLRDHAPRARYVTSVCTGSLILGAAGLLRGYRATTHWACHALLSAFGAERVEARVVTDRNRVSGGGVTAGIDFGLTLLAQLRGEQVAKLTQLMVEYDPEPPFDAGTPRTADPALVAQVRAHLDADVQRMLRVATVTPGHAASP
ncbi:DJ-1/PfpI family protein [Chondromyces apiculatus]|uniref:Transcriptional regulator, AraC family n=1 Tax=Chondromyces apiculatus DSM 436 TaxID=1192034 RepID=A0A017SUC1_9BACT|nr:DJ-1/PfpI family protein [Chondromyces apiculatus]EYF00558.1 Transcriptional regulator, AraC family [Chondromyces apiculatus DSM 436]